MKNQAGTTNVQKIKNSLQTIQKLTDQVKKGRMTTEKYIIEVHKNLSNMTNQRDYLDYLNNIGQN